jgi:hypothetical protein
MIPLRIVETERADFDQPVVELWRDDEFVGMVFWDDDTPVVQIYPDDDGDVKDLDVRELIRVLDMAEQIVSPVADASEFSELRASFGIRSAEPEEEGEGEAVEEAEDQDRWEADHPATMTLLDEFDPQVVHRTSDGEGFFPRSVAEEFIKRCDELDLAVVEMEGFDLEGAVLVPRPNLDLVVRVQGPTSWDVFRPAANARALDTLLDWPSRSTLVVAFVFQQPDGDTIVA